MTPTRKLIVAAFFAWPFALVAAIILWILYHWWASLLSGDGETIAVTVAVSAVASAVVGVRLILKWSDQ